MTSPEFADVLGPALVAALTQKGFTSLTPVQKAVLDPALAGRDLRITSQTGSGKTVAIGFAVRELVESAPAAEKGPARPRALVVAPTRELAKQVEEELTWLYATSKWKVAAVTGGASYVDERRSLAGGPRVIVGTPGRLLDHLKRGSIDATQVGAIILDEADRMLDLGFKEELEAILAFAPKDHLTHLISATFPRNVRSLADRVQREPAHVEGTPLGAANADIDHVVHLVDSRQRLNAIINLLLANPDEQTLVFCRTRADVAELAQILSETGFAVASISGEMEQPARNRALAEFRRGKLRALIATDVAARGIDVQDITRVIHADPPTDADTYTHRSGRTGRAGRKGTSSILVAPTAIQRTSMVLHRAKIAYRYEPIPTAAEILASRDERSFEELTRDNADGSTGFDPATLPLAERLAEGENVARTIARLLTRSQHVGPTEPREIRAFSPPTERGQQVRPLAEARESTGHAPKSKDFVLFRISWGSEQGADVRRLLPMVCRRGGIRGTDVGSIRVARSYSTVEIASAAADAFAAAAQAPDERNPRVTITRETPARVAPPPPAANAPHKPLPKPPSPPPAPIEVPRAREKPAQTLAAVREGVERALAEAESDSGPPPERPSRKRIEGGPHGGPARGPRPFPAKGGPAPHGTAARSFPGPGPKPRAEFTPRPGAGKGAARPHTTRTAPNHTTRTTPTHTTRTAPAHERPPSPPKGQRRYVDSTSRGQTERALRTSGDAPRPTSDEPREGHRKTHHSKPKPQGISPSSHRRDLGKETPRRKPRPS